MNSFSAIVDAFGGVSSFARATGRKRSWAKKVKERDSLNAAHFEVTARAAKAAGLPITLDDLARLASRTPVPANDAQPQERAA
jgi:hypothetical protein